jgi:hypothetical protein
MSRKRAIPELSVDTQILERLLLVLDVEEIVSYKSLSDAIGKDVQHRARHLLDSARNRALKREGFVLESVMGIGIKRLSDEGIAHIGHSVTKKIHRLSKRGLQKLVAVKDFDALSANSKRTHNLNAAMLGVLAYQTKTRTLRKLEAATSQSVLPAMKMLEAMKGALGS